MPFRKLLAWVSLALAASPAMGQVPFSRELVPTRTALDRVGLERQWMAMAPIGGPERVLGLSMAGDLFFAQTTLGYLHAFDAESGALLWSTLLGGPSVRSRPISANSFAVFVTNLNFIYALDRATGNVLWKKQMEALASSATAADEERMMVGLASGRVYGFDLKVKEPGKSRISDRPIDIWNWQSAGPAETRPLLAGRFIAFGSDDGKAYVGLADEPLLLFRFATGGPIGDGFGTYGTRLLLVPSADRNVYGVDLFTAQPLWSHGTGAPVTQAPLVAGEDIFVLNSAGRLSSVDPSNGEPRWVINSSGGRLVGVGASRVYLQTEQRDLYVIDRVTGRVVNSDRETRERAGLNMREYDLGVTNFTNDRLYFGTKSGFIICLREPGQVVPKPLRDPKAPAFGYVPREGIMTTPPITPPAELELEPEPAAP